MLHILRKRSAPRAADLEAAAYPMLGWAAAAGGADDERPAAADKPAKLKGAKKRAAAEAEAEAPAKQKKKKKAKKST